MSDIENKKTGDVPMHLRDASYKGASSFGHGKGYQYAHNYENNHVKQQYLPDEMIGVKYYEPTENGYEKVIKDRLDSLHKEK